MGVQATTVVVLALVAVLGQVCAWVPSYPYDREEERVFTKRAGVDDATPNLEQEFKKRCTEFLKPTRPAYHMVGKPETKDCGKLWAAFYKAFHNVADGKVEPKAYDDFFKLVEDVKVPKDKAAFYSGKKVRQFFEDHPPTTTDLYVIEHTLPGYVANSLVFCGDPKDSSGLGKACPNHSKTPGSAWYSFWQRNSDEWAKKAEGKVHVVLSTEYPNVYQPGVTMFSKYEIKVLNTATKVNEMELLLLRINKDLDKAEGCTPTVKGSIATLKTEAGSRLAFKCSPAPAKLQNLLDHPAQG